MNNGRTFELAQDRFRRGAFADAAVLLEGVEPGERSRDEALLLGVCLARCRRVPQAVSVFEEILREDPDCYEALTWIAGLKKNRQEIDRALACAERAVRLQPDEPEGHSVLGACYLYLRSAPLAVASFEKAVTLAPDIAEHRHNLGLARLMNHEHGLAIPQFRGAIELAPGNVQSYLALAGEYLKYGRVDSAIECLSAGLAVLPNSALLHTMTANAFASIRNDAAAERHHRRAMELSPDGKSGYASWLLNQGRFSDADAIYEAMLEEKPNQPTACYGFMQYRKLKEGDEPFVARMESLVEDPAFGVGGEMRLRYALGRAHEQLKRFEPAMSHFDAANGLAYRLHNAGFPFDADQLRRENDRVVSAYRGTLPSGGGSPSEQPIFIVGMIRSGTTLLDQILSSHSSVSAAGELRFWIEESLRLSGSGRVPTGEELESLAAEYLGYSRLLARETVRVTDKMPLNFAYMGLIYRALPNARFVHIRRHPVDTCLSIYTTYFGGGALFAYDRRNIVSYYREYLRMMEIWRSELPSDRLFELDYEALTGDPEPTIRAVLSFCGLDWDESCLRHDQNPITINTPSHWQARQPIYRSSVEKWRNYEPWLGEFAELLG